jgi:hypothetical protein
MLTEAEVAERSDSFYELDQVMQVADNELRIIIVASSGLAQLTNYKFVFDCATKIEQLIWVTELNRAANLPF